MSEAELNDSDVERMHSVPVWDWPVRLFHWAIVVLVVVSVVSGRTGGNAMVYHMYSGYTLLGLVLFRLLWGIVGSTYARFSHFVHGPRSISKYAKTLFKRTPSYTLGHNPLGGLMVVGLLLALLVQAGTGLFANDDIFIEGPLAKLVSKDISDWLTGIHATNIDLLFILIGLHVLAVLYYLLYKRENLITPMVIGNKDVPNTPAEIVIFPSLWRALILGLIIGGIMYLLVTQI
ncbi:MAG: cytochrome b/b6 domain-containing protein [Candidatus Competibacteraceae bacterium]|jgi:cytochrome b|nr:cytochrome b/b6 domain-containing protein [Candidatus Competibacteraceae bacterium]